MLISNPDLINSCRVCRNPNQDCDYVCMYDMDGQLNEAGKLYEDLFGKIAAHTYDYYPRYICNSCDLQMKLFRKLKDKALNTMEYLGKLYNEDLILSKEEAKFIITSDEDYMEDGQMIYEEGVDSIEEIGQEKQETPPVTGVGSEEVSANAIYIIPNALQETNKTPDITYVQSDMDFEKSLQNQLTEVNEESTELSEVQDLQHIPGIDKTDYVLEIYKVLEDGTQNVVSESGLETEEVRTNDVDGNSNFDIEETDASQYSFIDEQYVDMDSCGTAEKLDDDDEDYRPAKRHKANKTVPQTGDNIKIHTCTECNEVFTCSKEFKHHRTYVHTQTYACKICSAVMKSARILSTHMKIHTDSPAFRCEICQRTFTQKVHFQYHMNRHNNVRNFKCDECDKSFLTKSDLKIHMRLHTGDRPYVCETCGKGYMLSEHLKTHALTHTDQQFPCELCSLKFATPKTLRQHVTTIHAPEPKFKCEYCMKPFRRKHHLQYHMKLHPKNILAGDDTETITSVDNADDLLEVYSQGDIVTDDQLEEDPNDFIKDPGFVALTDETILM